MFELYIFSICIAFLIAGWKGAVAVVGVGALLKFCIEH